MGVIRSSPGQVRKSSVTSIRHGNRLQIMKRKSATSGRTLQKAAPILKVRVIKEEAEREEKSMDCILCKALQVYHGPAWETKEWETRMQTGRRGRKCDGSSQ